MALCINDKKTKEHHRKPKVTGSFYECLKIVLFNFKILGILPLSIVRRESEELRISWTSPYNIFLYIPFMSFSIIFKSIQAYRVLSGKPQILLFFGMILVESMLILRFCQKCNKLIEDVENLEKVLPPIKRPRSFMRYVRRFVAIFCCLGIGNMLVIFIYDVDKTIKCQKRPESSRYFITNLLETTSGVIIELLPLSYTVSLMVQLIKFHEFMIWYFCDILIMVVCLYLNERFRNFNRLIMKKEFSFQQSFRPSWSTLQVHYTHLSRIVAIVDDHINCIVFVSYAYNMYYICLNLYYFLNNLTATTNTYSYMYDCNVEHRKSWVSFLNNTYTMLFLVLRTVMVSHLAAELHNLSRKPLDVLHTAPSADYDSEMQRLMEQVYHSKVGVSGLRFFQITRKAMLAIIARVMTCELVLLQFSADSENN